MMRNFKRDPLQNGFEMRGENKFGHFYAEKDTLRVIFCFAQALLDSKSFRTIFPFFKRRKFKWIVTNEIPSSIRNVKGNKFQKTYAIIVIERKIFPKFKMRKFHRRMDSKRLEKIKFDHFSRKIHRCAMKRESVRNLDKYNRIRNAWRKLNSIIFQRIHNCYCDEKGICSKFRQIQSDSKRLEKINSSEFSRQKDIYYTHGHSHRSMRGESFSKFRQIHCKLDSKRLRENKFQPFPRQKDTHDRSSTKGRIFSKFRQIHCEMDSKRFWRE